MRRKALIRLMIALRRIIERGRTALLKLNEVRENTGSVGRISFRPHFPVFRFSSRKRSPFKLRLRQIKIAGFKSFADPTEIDIRDPFIVIVGPNGCGKSNIIDAVRWVLGEGRVSELRGKAASELIFAGSTARKPLGRASVELVLDNSDHAVKGPWGQYEELSIRRVVTGEGLSAYYINHQQVRRRDVQEIFLGTGLGSRSYAIVSQHMIACFTSAKPEELRNYLEEAAGVSLYKERRRETESHLKETQENLERAGDLQAMRAEEIERLRGEAATAARWIELDKKKTESEALWYFLQCEAARNEADAAKADIIRTENDIAMKRRAIEECEGAQEALVADERRADAEYQRISNDFQNAEKELARLEGEMSRLVERRRKAEHDREEAQKQIAQKEEALENLERDNEERSGRIEMLEEDLAEFEAMNEARQEELDRAEEAERAAREASEAAGRVLADARTEERLKELELSREKERVRELEARLKRLGDEEKNVSRPDPERLKALTEELSGLQEESEALAAMLEEALERAERSRERAAERSEFYFSRLSELKSQTAKLQTLEEVQKEALNADALTEWLKNAGIDGLPELADAIEVPDDLITALEAVLEHRTRAFLLRDLRSAADFARRRPPARLSFAAPAASGGAEKTGGWELGGKPVELLRSKIETANPAARAAIDAWCSGAALAPDLAGALREREKIPAGHFFVTPLGDIVTNATVTFWAAEDPRLALLSRGREIRELKARIDDFELQVAEADDERQKASGDEARARREAESLQVKKTEAERRLSKLTLEERDARAELEAAQRREADLKRSREELETEFEEVSARSETALQLAEEAAEKLDNAERAAGEAAARHGRSQDRLIEIRRAETENIHRAAMKKLEISQAQEALRTAERRGTEIQSDIEREKARLEEAQKSLAEDDQNVLEKGAAELLEKSAEFERAAGDAQGRLQEAKRRTEENLRLMKTLNAEILPLTEKAGLLRGTAEQKATLVGQLSSRLDELGVEAEKLRLIAIERGMKVTAVRNEVSRLMNEIAALGPVNHAALAHLEAAENAWKLAAAQMDDLARAVETLENAIRRIDMETRARMRETFEKVNAGFDETFRLLFGGGDASLQIVGDEILTAGVAMSAHPPGKRNSTLNQLSSGEQTLTAIALIFAMFRLNPAPFCLLDEVDGPLDEANQGRLARLCIALSEATQFLVISHHRFTMEHASSLIGVTMKEPGVSRIVSVDVKEAVEIAKADAAARKKAG